MNCFKIHYRASRLYPNALKTWLPSRVSDCIVDYAQTLLAGPCRASAPRFCTFFSSKLQHTHFLRDCLHTYSVVASSIGEFQTLCFLICPLPRPHTRVGGHILLVHRSEGMIDDCTLTYDFKNV